MRRWVPKKFIRVLLRKTSKPMFHRRQAPLLIFLAPATSIAAARSRKSAKVADVSAEETLAAASHATTAAANGAGRGDGEGTAEKTSVVHARGAVNGQLVGPLPRQQPWKVPGRKLRGAFASCVGKLARRSKSTGATRTRVDGRTAIQPLAANSLAFNHLAMRKAAVGT